jgi:hypothetical protein
VLPDGTLVLASPANGDGTTSAHVCVLHPGGRSCASTATLTPESGDAFYGVSEVLATGGTDVSVVLYACCNSDPTSVFVYNSTNDGKTFSSYVRAGENLGGVGAGTVADGQLVVANYEHGSLQVQSVSPHQSSPQTQMATPPSPEVDDADTSLTTYDGGVLVASDDGTNTFVDFARSGSNFNDSSSYTLVAAIPNQVVTGVSDNALLTDPGGSLTGGERLRYFNGTSYGTAYKVPDAPHGGDDGYFTLQEVGGVVHVFFESRDNGYDLFSEVTLNGSHWSPFQQYGTAIHSSALVPVLGPAGAGVVFESDSGSSQLAQPILDPQTVHIALQHSRVTAGTSTKLSGHVSPHLKNQTVTLEKEVSHRWYTDKSTKEAASGAFLFNVPGETDWYRVVIADQPGYYLYGYSSSVLLTAVPKKS